MSAPMRVQVERVRRTPSELFGTIFGRLAGSWLLTGYFVMLLVPLAFHVNVSYWQAVAIAGLVNVLTTPSTSYLSWTHPAPKQGKR